MTKKNAASAITDATSNLPRPGDKVMIPVSELPVRLGQTENLPPVFGWTNNRSTVDIGGETYYYATVTAVGTRRGGGLVIYFKPYGKVREGSCEASRALGGWPHPPKGPRSW